MPAVLASPLRSSLNAVSTEKEPVNGTRSGADFSEVCGAASGAFRHPRFSFNLLRSFFRSDFFDSKRFVRDWDRAFSYNLIPEPLAIGFVEADPRFKKVFAMLFIHKKVAFPCIIVFGDKCKIIIKTVNDAMMLLDFIRRDSTKWTGRRCISMNWPRAIPAVSKSQLNSSPEFS